MKAIFVAICISLPFLASGADVAKFPAISLNTQTNVISDNGSSITYNGTSIIGSSVQTFDPTKTYLVIGGNSRALPSSPGVIHWGDIITNSWPGLLYYTNIAGGGTDFAYFTNRLYTEVIPLLPTAPMSNGTNAIVSLCDNLLEFNSGSSTNATQCIDKVAALFLDLHARGITTVLTTVAPANYWPSGPKLPDFFQYNNWALLSSNLCDYVPDFASIMTDPYDTTYYVDGVHFTDLGNILLAHEWNSVVKLGQRRLPWWQKRVGTNIVTISGNFSTVTDTFADNGYHTRINAGTVNTNDFSASSGVFGGTGFTPALIAFGALGQAANIPVLSAGAYSAYNNFNVYPDGHFTSGGGDSTSAGTFTAFTGDGAGTYIAAYCFASGGVKWKFLSVPNFLKIRNDRDTLDAITVATNGNVTVLGSIAAPSVLFGTNILSFSGTSLTWNGQAITVP